MLKKVLKENYIYFIALFLITLLLTIIMKSNIYNYILKFDEKVINYVPNIRNDNLTIFFKIMTEFGNVFIPTLIIIILFFTGKNKIKSIIQALAYSFSGIFSLITKYLVSRSRPSTAIINLPISSSFPSGHTLTSFVFYMILYYLVTINKSKTVKIILFVITTILVLLIGISRIYLGVHYFSDVVGGYIYGIILFLLIRRIIELNYKNKVK